MISVIIPTYKEARHLTQTLDHLLNQTYQNFEIIIIDDGLYKEARENIEKYLENKNKGNIKLIKQTPAGAPTARNKGVGESKGEFLFFCDDDVILKKEALEKLESALRKNPEVSYVYCDFYLGFKSFKTFDFNAERLKKMPYISVISLVRRDHFPGYDQSLKKFQDWDLWLTMLKNKHIGFHLPEILFKALPRKQGLSSWLPSFVYKIPWRIFPFKFFVPQAIKKYQEGMRIIKEKHQLN